MTRGGQHTEHAIKQFYANFKREQAYFLQAIQSTASPVDCQRYVMLLLIRLMLTYFLQKKRLLDGDTDYLHNRLRQIQKSHQSISFLTFYQSFLHRLFHQEFDRAQHEPISDKLMGNVPYFNGGIFDQHTPELPPSRFHIPDDAFERLFAFFDCYRWHLDTQPELSENELTPDVINYVFEQLMKQQVKQKGIYYTKEDITIYMASNTIIPRLLEMVEQQCPVAFRPCGPIWRLLQDNPDRYIYAAIKKGCSVPLPAEIAAGRDNIAHRILWNTPFPQSFRDNALPAETWHELIARRQHYTELQARLSSGTVLTINELITLNLNIRQFVQDVIGSSDDIQIIWAFYCSLTGQEVSPTIESLPCLSILDPTCGSGAFLLAALNVLEPIYEACIERIQTMLDENVNVLERIPPNDIHLQHILQKFHLCLNTMKQCPNRSFFILKSITTNNLYGIDLMPEATELCRLRLFLKLVAQIDSIEHVKQLPAINFNISSGNALHGPVERGKFEVIIGNPPYISSRIIDYPLPQDEKKFPNIYASILIHILSLCTARSRLSMIVPLSLMFSRDFTALRNILITAGYSWFASFDTIPAALFPDVNQRCTIWLAARSTESHLFVTPMYRWRSEARSTLLSRISYIALNDHDVATSGIPRLATLTQQHLFTRIKAAEVLPQQNDQHLTLLGFSQAARNFISVFLEPPPCFDEQTLAPVPTPKIGYLVLPSRQITFAALALLSGDVYFWYWLVRGDGFDVTKWIITDFLAVLSACPASFVTHLAQLGQLLHTRRFEAMTFKKNAGKYVGNYNYRAVPHLTRRADLLLLIALEIERSEALELLNDVQRVLSINEWAGEKAIPDSLKNMFTPRPPPDMAEHTILATIDDLLTTSYALTTEELHSLLYKMEKSHQPSYTHSYGTLQTTSKAL